MDCLNLCEEARNLITDVQVNVGQGHWDTLNPVCVCVCVVFVVVMGSASGLYWLSRLYLQ